MEKKTNNITELVFILDRSGSMSGLEADTIGGFNSMIEKQRIIELKVQTKKEILNTARKYEKDFVVCEKYINFANVNLIQEIQQ